MGTDSESTLGAWLRKTLTELTANEVLRLGAAVALVNTHSFRKVSEQSNLAH